MFSYRELTERLAQYGECDHYDETKQFFPGFLKQTLKIRIFERHPLSSISNLLGVAAGAGVALLLRFPFPELRGDILALLQG